MIELTSALDYAQAQREKALSQLIELLRIPSISTLPEYKPDVQRAANWLAESLKSLNLDQVEVLQTDGLPVVYGEWLHAGPEAPTMLVYGHYDVQPPDPVDEWESPPFEPQMRQDNLYARGASDMKAQIIAHISALEAILKTSDLPINIKYMLEGEEEIGSPSLEAFILQNKKRLESDFCLNCDAMILDPETPALTYTLRGLAYFELRLQGAASDLHSGMFGGAIDNPANVLCELIAGMRDQTGKVTIPGFYDNVRPLSDQERQEMITKPDTWWLEQTGAQVLFGEKEFSPSERATARPTLDVNGLLSGFTGAGSKTVLPAKAMAKISMRLVPDQHPKDIENLMRAYLEANAPATVSWELEDLSSCNPSISERDSDPVHAATRAFEATWGRKPVFLRVGGSVPVVGQIQEFLGLESLIMGFSLPDDNLHAPNEKQHIPSFYRGIETYIHFMSEVANATFGKDK